MMLRLHRLSSEPKLFKPIEFFTGINLILGEKWDDGQTQGRKVNGVGKSLSVEFLHFALLREFTDTRVALIPRDKLHDDLVIILALTINGHSLEIRRAIAHPQEPIIVRNGQAIQFGNLGEATRYLGDLMFSKASHTGFSSFRSLMSLLMRDEASEFSDILRTMPSDRIAPPDRMPHLFLMGLEVANYRILLERIRELESQSKVLTRLRADLTERGQHRVADIKAELNQSQQEVQMIEAGLQALKAEPAFAQVEGDINELETKLTSLRAHRKGVSYQIDQIRAIPQMETIDETDLKIVYDRVKAGLGDLVTKSLEQAKAFKAEIESFQRSLREDELTRLEAEQRELTEKIRLLSDQHSALVAQIDRRGTLKELSAGLSVAHHKQQDYYRRSALYDQFNEAEQRKEDLKSERQMALDTLRKQLHDHKEIETSMNAAVVAIHERVMGNRNASFAMHISSNVGVKYPLDFEMRIQDDGSHSVDRTMVFIYDTALMFASCTQAQHPRFLLHDNIFDVDQDTLVQCLNFLHEKVEAGEDFQYILTLNREKVEEEERSKRLLLDVETAKRAKFTKQTPFLGFRYQESRKNR